MSNHGVNLAEFTTSVDSHFRDTRQTIRRWTVVFVFAAILHAVPLAMRLALPANGVRGNSDSALNVTFSDERLSPVDYVDGELANSSQQMVSSLGGPTGQIALQGSLSVSAPVSRPREDSLPNARSISDEAVRAHNVTEQTDRGARVHEGTDEPLGAGDAADDANVSVGYAVVAPKHSSGNSLDRLVSSSGGGGQGPALRLPGKPIYPKACRDGLCRHGRPCEGVSVWEVHVPAPGGRPTQVVCVQAMECELQNASIRTFFGGANFPKAEREMTYIFTVPMWIHPESPGSRGEE